MFLVCVIKRQHIDLNSSLIPRILWVFLVLRIEPRSHIELHPHTFFLFLFFCVLGVFFVYFEIVVLRRAFAGEMQIKIG